MKPQRVSDFCREHNLTRASVYRMIREGILPAIRNPATGRGIRVDPAKVLSILEKPATAATATKGAA